MWLEKKRTLYEIEKNSGGGNSAAGSGGGSGTGSGSGSGSGSGGGNGCARREYKTFLRLLYEFIEVTE